MTKAKRITRKRRKRPNARVPLKPSDILGLVDIDGNTAILAALFGLTFQEKVIIGAIITNVLKPMLRNVHKESLAATAVHIINTAQEEAKESATVCGCKGACLCHTGLQLGCVPCPKDCPNFGKVLDGCHRCDCKGGCKDA